MAGNCATGSYDVKLDTVDPLIKYDKRRTLAQILKNTVTGTVTDSTLGIVKVEVSGGMKLLTSENGGVTLSCGGGRHSCTWSVRSKDLKQGRYKLTVTVTDTAGISVAKRDTKLSM